MKKTSCFVALVIAILLYACNRPLGNTPEPDPHKILKEMILLYANAESYQDNGTVTVVSGDPTFLAGSDNARFENASSQNNDIVTFRFYFARPGMFRFEWENSFLPVSRTSVVWSDGKQAYGWLPMMPAKDGRFTLYNAMDLKGNVVQSTRLSAGAIFSVPSLLDRDIAYSTFADMLISMKAVRLLREEPFDGEICYVIEGRISDVPKLLWVGKESRLLRKTRTSYSSNSFHDKMAKKSGDTLIAEEIHRNIKINERIPKEVFNYKSVLQKLDIDGTR